MNRRTLALLLVLVLFMIALAVYVAQKMDQPTLASMTQDTPSPSREDVASAPEVTLPPRAAMSAHERVVVPLIVRKRAVPDEAIVIEPRTSTESHISISAPAPLPPASASNLSSRGETSTITSSPTVLYDTEHSGDVAQRSHWQKVRPPIGTVEIHSGCEGDFDATIRRTNFGHCKYVERVSYEAPGDGSAAAGGDAGAAAAASAAGDAGGGSAAAGSSAGSSSGSAASAGDGCR